MTERHDPSTGENLVVVFDANVLIPMLLFASRSSQLFARLLNARAHVAISPQLIAEVEDKLRHKSSLRKWLGVTDTDIDAFLLSLPVLCQVVSGALTAPGSVPTDPDDEAVIAAALEAEAEYIVTEDHHLLDLKSYAGIHIVNRAGLDSKLDELGVPR